MKFNGDFKKILVIEDDINLASIIKQSLQVLHCKINTVNDGKVGLCELMNTQYNIAILDMVLPSMNGLQVLNSLVNQEIDLPIIMITVNNSITNQINAFDKGVNIFHAKPISFPLLISQVKSILLKQEIPDMIELDHITLNISKKSLDFNNTQIQLSPTEFQFLLNLIKAKGRILTRRELFQNNTNIDTIVCRIRRKLAKVKASYLVETVYKYGYRISCMSL